jgi:hypothetical protein
VQHLNVQVGDECYYNPSGGVFSHENCCWSRIIEIDLSLGLVSTEDGHFDPQLPPRRYRRDGVVFVPATSSIKFVDGKLARGQKAVAQRKYHSDKIQEALKVANDERLTRAQMEDFISSVIILRFAICAASPTNI